MLHPGTGEALAAFVKPVKNEYNVVPRILLELLDGRTINVNVTDDAASIFEKDPGPVAVSSMDVPHSGFATLHWQPIAFSHISVQCHPKSGGEFGGEFRGVPAVSVRGRVVVVVTPHLQMPIRKRIVTEPELPD